MLATTTLLAAIVLASTGAIPRLSAPDTRPLPLPLPLATLEDYRRTAGHRVRDTLVASMSVRTVRWRPEGTKGAELPVYAFVEDGRAPRVPGPLLRVSSGESIRLTLRNTLDDTLVVYGLGARGSGRGIDSVRVAPGARETIAFTTDAPGTFNWYARRRPEVVHPTAPVPAFFSSGEGPEGPLVGVLIVDPAGAPPAHDERIFLITRWTDDTDPRVHGKPDFKLMVNGASWPHTERLHYAIGDTVRWRVINATATQHPFHLHGFYFTVTSLGDNVTDSLFAPPQERRVVTQVLNYGESMALRWVPERAGNWLFHCHLVRHMSLAQRIGPSLHPGAKAPRSLTRDFTHSMDEATVASSVHHAEENMAGLVMGIEVTPARRTSAAAQARTLALASGRDAGAAPQRMMRLVATERAQVFGRTPGHGFVLQEGTTPPAPDSMRFPGSTLVLHKGEPTAITVVNTLSAPLAVHWHGLEIESWFDGVGGWSGAGSRVRPPIAPRDSFVVHLTPPRAGTFIYHTHDEAGSELNTGLYGALIVEDPSAPRDTTRDHVFVIGMLGARDSLQLAVNGRVEGEPVSLAAGVRHRLRFVSIPVDEEVDIRLVHDTVTAPWRVVARDGADLPNNQQQLQSGKVRMTAGQTLDVEVDVPVDADERWALEFRTKWYPTLDRPRPVLRVPFLAAARR